MLNELCLKKLPTFNFDDFRNLSRPNLNTFALFFPEVSILFHPHHSELKMTKIAFDVLAKFS